MNNILTLILVGIAVFCVTKPPYSWSFWNVALRLLSLLCGSWIAWEGYCDWKDAQNEDKENEE